eukprot:64790-Pyramimonas_sp.AAC.1
MNLVHGDRPGEDQLSRAGHDDPVVGLPPVNLEGPAGELNHALAVDTALQHARHHSGAGAGATRQRNARAALPHPHLHVPAVDHLHELGVGARREDGEILELAADLLQRDVRHLDVLTVLAVDH